jgi:hypothetical protein
MHSQLIKRITTTAAFFVVLLWSHGVVAQCLEYEPREVRLSGVLIRQTYPGPPNYESIKHGDAAETIWVLRLNQAICVVASSSDEIDVRESNQKEIQLVLEPDQYKEYRNLVRQRVIVTGKLFHSHTGHHHKRLLLTTTSIRKTQK